MKRILFIICCSLFASIALGASDEVLRISNATELAQFATAVNAGNSFEGETVILTADIVLDEADDWMPIGTTDAPFCGIFDGQGHWVSNVYVDVDGRATGDVAGLFGCIGTTGIVRCVGVQSGSIHIAAKSSDVANCYVGGIAGLNSGHIEQCANLATVVGNYIMTFVGGIAGANGNIMGGETSATIEDCYNLGRIFTNKTEYSDQNYLGGIAGISDGLVQHVYSNAEISQAAVVDGIATYSIVAPQPVGTYATGDMTGFALDGGLNTAGDYSVWSFAEERLPELTYIQETHSLLLGDVNQDGQITIADVTALVNILLGKAPEKRNADVNQDGQITIADVTTLVNLILSLSRQ
ncbi:MAG: dockerin type I repeat-containing protein [Bacteroidaceae bacterium]|nr:dockerin type I repeat-containing protein [Bacteroidaceae bacterium]